MVRMSDGGSAPGQRILAVDPGLTRCGFAVVDMATNRTGTFVHVEVNGTRAHEALEDRVLIAQCRYHYGR